MTDNMNVSGKKSFDINQLKGGVRISDFAKNKEQIKLFDKLDTGDVKGFLTSEEVEEFCETLEPFLEDGKISKKETKAIAKALGLEEKELNRKQLEMFIKNFGLASDKIARSTMVEDSEGTYLAIKYKPDENGKVLTELQKTDGSGLYATIENNTDGSEITKYFYPDGVSVEEEFIEKGELLNDILYDKNGEQLIRKETSGAITKYFDKDDRLTDEIQDCGNGLKISTSYKYDDDGNLESKTITDINNKQTVYDGEGKVIETSDTQPPAENVEKPEVPEQTPPPKKSVHNSLGELLKDGKATAHIDGTATKLTAKAYDGEIRLPNGQTFTDGEFPKSLRMSLPSEYGKNASMSLTLKDEANGIYESSAHDRHFQVTVDDNGRISVTSVDIEQLQAKLDANLKTYKEVLKSPGATETTPKKTIPQKDKKPPVKDEKPPVGDKNPPKQVALKMAPLSLPELGISNLSKVEVPLNPDKQEVTDYVSGKKYTYDENGFISQSENLYNKNKREFERNPDGSVEKYYDYEYDAQGKRTRLISHNSDGSIGYFYDTEYDTDGRQIREISRNSDGSVKEYYDTEYDTDGKEIREILYNPDGSVKEYYNFEYDAEGRQIREIIRGSSGSVIEYYDFEYDAEGQTKAIRHNPDGSLPKQITI